MDQRQPAWALGAPPPHTSWPDKLQSWLGLGAPERRWGWGGKSQRASFAPHHSPNRVQTREKSSRNIALGCKAGEGPLHPTLGMGVWDAVEWGWGGPDSRDPCCPRTLFYPIPRLLCTTAQLSWVPAVRLFPNFRPRGFPQGLHPGGVCAPLARTPGIFVLILDTE